MADFVDAIAKAAALAVVIGGSGAVFAFGFGVVCRYLKWAPINITVQLIDQRDI